MENPQFFNYHEFSLDPEKNSSEPEELCVSHFPDIYCKPTRDGMINKNYRIVRIPRRFENTLGIPYFSNVLPGNEPAALTYDYEDQGFLPHENVDGIAYGISSFSPLSLYISPEEFQNIIDKVNRFLEEGFRVNSFFNFITIILDFLLLGAWDIVFNYFYFDSFQELERYVQQLNNSDLFKRNNIRLISPQKSGYLSLDFEVPTPRILRTNSEADSTSRLESASTSKITPHNDQ
ncbi:hypothetical protein TBLA_0B08470 [Henningerozyma blattae CBS 6284]|uniref:Ras modification protein ERF4 n=1 Tax=Henningerozyma blattae (strain ATCC 34711 / CBS 6284 / DSM 70876 / NBRC 10599 / NRRL Y-10934 / UCD 77-7) TaxID=1071380 RepID=I2GZW0_HENB6|nr:hypothetical protein TBLA_0B08470 [Tetrapisispora blattae CBS 6284]CCH59662.1 hypothetical protein TBLA_0B08470 [Tetrapisispora blattae CBS 6284]